MRNRALRTALAGAMAMALAGCGSHDAGELVHKDRSTVYAAFAEAMKEDQGETTSDGFSLDVKETPNDKIDVDLMHHGESATHFTFNFTKQNGDKDTLVTADVGVDSKVLSEALGPAKGGSALASTLTKAAFKIGLQKMLRKSAERIEAGMPLEMGHSSFSRPEGSSEYAEYERKYEQQRQQANATAPMTDPDQAARQYMSSSGSSSSPSYSGY